VERRRLERRQRLTTTVAHQRDETRAEENHGTRFGHCSDRAIGGRRACRVADAGEAVRRLGSQNITITVREKSYDPGAV